jgi:hypothetical protein
MKSIVFAVLLSAVVRGQTPPMPKVVPGTLGPPPAAAPGATSAEPIASEAVILEVNGKKYTKAEMDALIAGLPVQYQQAVRTQPQSLGQVFLFKRLAEDAEKEGLDKQSPYKGNIGVSADRKSGQGGTL